MENRVFVMLKNWYEVSGEILSMGELQKQLMGKYAVEYVVEGVYQFDWYLDVRRGSVG